MKRARSYLDFFILIAVLLCAAGAVWSFARGAVPAAGRLFDEKLLTNIVIIAGDQAGLVGRPVSRQRAGDTLVYLFRPPQPPDLEVCCKVVPVVKAGGKGEQLLIRLACDRPLQQDLTIRVPLTRPRSALISLPQKNGVVATMPGTETATYRFAGMDSAVGRLLSVPLLWLPQQDGARQAHLTDPYYSTMFTPSGIEWTYPAAVGLEHGVETRMLASVAVAGGADAALASFFALALPDVPAGPSWLHDIAMVDYDYLSDAGQGWFRDIDALTSVINRSDRQRVILCLHGWYDWVGRYCYEVDQDRLDETWTAFANYPNVSAKFANSKPMAMNLADMHRRIRYARDRGFRVALYFADGMLSGDQLVEVNAEPQRVLFMGGWQGPDTKGKSFCQSPLYAPVRHFYSGYLAALLREYGQEIDALVWDETFYVENGSLGTAALRGYADRAMMGLVKELTQTVRRYNDRHGTGIAFLTADCIGLHNYPEKALYSLVADGTYHDTSCQPPSWSFGIFPNYRNTLWSCNWYPVSRYAYTEFGVRTYQAPVAISNGYGDDIGFAEMKPEMQKQIIDLFQWRLTFKTRLRGLDTLIEYAAPPAGK